MDLLSKQDQEAAEEYAINVEGDVHDYGKRNGYYTDAFLAGIKHERERTKKLVGSAYDWCENEITEWMTLLEKAHKTTPYSNPKEAEREHGNEMRLLQVIKQKIIKQRAKTIAEYEGGQR